MIKFIPTLITLFVLIIITLIVIFKAKRDLKK